MDDPDDKKVFTFDQAAALLPEVRRLTEAAQARLASLGQRAEGGGETTSAAAEAVIGGWVRSVVRLGAEVKGLWLVDFDNGSGYYCWKFPEPGLQFYHSYEDGFGGRVRIH